MPGYRPAEMDRPLDLTAAVDSLRSGSVAIALGSILEKRIRGKEEMQLDI